MFYVKGATERILALCSHLLEQGQLRKMTAADRDRVAMETSTKEDAGMRSRFHTTLLVRTSLVLATRVGFIRVLPARVNLEHES